MQYIIIIIIILLVIWVMAAYNGFVKGKNLVKEAWSGIDVQLKRRYDLIPNLIETVKGYAGHEKKLFEDIANLRSQSMKSDNVKEKSEAESQLTGTLRTLFAVAESYPQIKSNENFMELQKSLERIEEEMQLARRYYNGTVRNFNTNIETFPNVLISSAFGFKKYDFFEVEDAAERKVPEVKF
ncbi:MAG: LemA family protein [Bacillota bacterium]|nr:LemA family protein [Bacillota bacterium]